MKYFLLSGALTVMMTSFFCVLSPVLAQGDLGSEVKDKLATGGQSSLLKSDRALSTIVGGIINAFLAIVGAVSLYLFVWGGFELLMGGGNEEKVSAGKAKIKNSVIGLIIVIAAYAIVKFIAEFVPALLK